MEVMFVKTSIVLQDIILTSCQVLTEKGAAVPGRSLPIKETDHSRFCGPGEGRHRRYESAHTCYVITSESVVLDQVT